jgi:hypothetical protein
MNRLLSLAPLVLLLSASTAAAQWRTVEAPDGAHIAMLAVGDAAFALRCRKSHYEFMFSFSVRQKPMANELIALSRAEPRLTITVDGKSPLALKAQVHSPGAQATLTFGADGGFFGPGLVDQITSARTVTMQASLLHMPLGQETFDLAGSPLKPFKITCER